jgi:hypothetical protein
VKALALLILAAATVAAVFYLLSRDADGQVPAPTCGFGQSYTSAQSWWTSETGGTDFGHLHAEGCVPERWFILGPTPLKLKIVMHDNPSTIKIHQSIVTKGKSYETTVLKLTGGIGMTCPVGTCERTLDFVLSPAHFQESGLQEIRYRVFADTPDGNRMTASLNYQAYVWDRVTPLSQWEFVNRMPYLRSKGWYTDAEYCEASYLSVPLRQLRNVRGLWRPAVKVLNHDSSLPVSRHMVTIDPDFHAHDHGQIVTEGEGQLPATQLSIDTTKLANGWHKLAIKADCDDPRGSVNSGIGIVHFKVAN